MNRTILHSDCNCFYASVELLHHPELRGKPVAVGGDPEARHGIVLTADYTAKRYGVKTGMALWQAKQVCPDITFLPPRMDLYLRFSRMAQEIYADYTDKREPYGIDESWLDVTDSATLKGDGFHIAQEISSRMKKELGITVSVGVSFNKIFAKLGSDYKKPDAITTMYEDEFQRKAWCLPVSDLLYVGNATNKKLYSMGIRTIGDLAKSDETLLVRKLGKMGSILWAFANGYDESPVKLENTSAPVKSVGNSTTTPRDMETDEDVRIVLYILAESVAARLRENGFRCRTVEISVRDKELFHFSKRVKLQNASNITKEIAEAGYRLYKDNYRLPADDKEQKSSRPEFFQKPLRSIGIRGTDLVTDYFWEQLDIFMDPQAREKQMKMDETVDIIRKCEPQFQGRLKWISERDNGLYDAMNKGIRMSTGEIVGIINSDDFYHRRDIISRVVEAFRNEKTQTVYGDVRFVNPDNLDKTVRYYSSRNFSPSRFRYGFMPAHPTFFTYRKYFEEFGYYKTDYHIAADYELLIRFLYTHQLKSKYLSLDFMKMRTGGASTASIKSNILLNKEIVRACSENGIWTCMPLLFLKYFIKVFELFLTKE